MYFGLRKKILGCSAFSIRELCKSPTRRQEADEATKSAAAWIDCLHSQGHHQHHHHHHQHHHHHHHQHHHHHRHYHQHHHLKDLYIQGHSENTLQPYSVLDIIIIVANLFQEREMKYNYFAICCPNCTAWKCITCLSAYSRLLRKQEERHAVPIQGPWVRMISRMQIHQCKYTN